MNERPIKGLRVTCEVGHIEVVNPAMICGDETTFGSASGFCQYRMKSGRIRRLKCERPIVERTPIYSSPC